MPNIQEKEREWKACPDRFFSLVSLCGTVHMFVHHLEHG